MKKFIFALVGIFSIGAFLISLPYIISNFKEKRGDINTNLLIQKKNNNSKIETVEEIPFDDLESEVYDENQMYFENIDTLYTYFNFREVENIKQKIQFYVHNNIDKSILDCSIIKDSIKVNNDIIKISINMDGVENLVVKVTKIDDEIKKITLIHS